MIEYDIRSIPKSPKIRINNNPALERELNDTIDKHQIHRYESSIKDYKSHIIALVDTLAELVGQSSYFKEFLKQELSDHDLI